MCQADALSNFTVYFDSYVTLYQCQRCSFVAQYPELGRQTIVEDYEHFYSLDFVKQGKQFQYPERTNSFIDMVERLKKIVGSQARVLDVGSGEGHFMSIAESRGLECVGVEPSSTLADYATTRVAGEVKKGYYHKELFPPESFDAVTLVQVLEHLVDPGAALDTAYYHLRPGGVVMIEVPSILAPHFLAYRLTGIQKFVKPPTGVIYSHVGYFSPHSLVYLAQRHKFKTHHITTGRWRVKYHGLLKAIATITDPIMNVLKIGGILYFGKK